MSEFAESLVRQLEEHVESIRSAYTTGKQQKDHVVTDNEPHLRILCQLVERILRYGQKEKLSFWGDRKDYWNYISDSVQGHRDVEEVLVKTVQAQSQLQTAQGKGRALIRNCLMKHSLAEVIQICVQGKQTNDWYRPDAILRKDKLSSLFISTLYELNDVDFQLSNADQDLDLQWPSFSKKAFCTSPDSLSYSTYAMSSDFAPKPFADAPIATPAKQESRRKASSQVTPVSFDSYLSLLAKVMQTDGSSSSSSEEEEEVLPSSVLHFKQKLSEWKSRSESKLADLRCEVEHERQEREADAVDADQLQESLKKELSDYRQAEAHMKARLDEVAKRLETKSGEATSAEEKALDLERRIKSFEVDSLGWQTRLEDAQKEASGLRSEMEEYRRQLEALEADHEFICTVKKEVDEKCQDQEEACAKQKSIADTLAKELEVMRKSNYEEKALREELESKLFEADVRLSNLLRDYENRQDESEELFEQKERHVAELQNLVTHQEKLVAAQETRVQVSKVETQRKEAEKVDFKKLLGLEKRKVEQLENEVKAGKRELAALEGKLAVKESELGEKADILKKLGESGGVAGVDSSSGLSKQLFEALSRESEARQQLVDIKKDLAEVTAELKVEKERGKAERRVLVRKVEELERKGETFEGLWDAERKKKRDRAEASRIVERQLSGSLGNLESIYEKANQSSNYNDNGQEEETFLASSEDSPSRFLMESLEKVKAELEQERKRRILAEQDCSSLKFQMSTELMQFKQQQEDIKMKEKESQMMRKSYSDLEHQLEKMKDSLVNFEKQKGTKQMESAQLRQTNEELLNKLSSVTSDLSSLQEQLLQTTVERDQRRRECLNLEDEFGELKDKSSFADKNLTKKLEDLSAEYNLVKEQFVNLTRNKVELWEQNVELQGEVAARLASTWKDDSKVTRCLDCHEEFSLTLRKHHCRSCGNVFCGPCSNKFLNLPSDSKPSRVCINCHDLIKEAKDKGFITPSSKRNRKRSQTSSSESSSVFLTTSSRSERAKSHSSTLTTPKSRDRPSDIEESYAIIDDAEIRQVDPDYMSSGQETNQSQSDSPVTTSTTSTTVDDSLTGTGPDAPSVAQRDGYTLSAGAKHKIIVLVIKENVRISWNFVLEGNSKISFGVMHKCRESKGDGDFLIPLKRFSAKRGFVSGDLTTQRPGMYTLLLDNTSSRVTDRKVSYKVKTSKP